MRWPREKIVKGYARRKHSVLKEKQRRPSAGTDSPSSLPKILLYAAVPLVIALVAVQYSGVLEPLLGMLK